MCIFGAGALHHICSYLRMVGIDKMTVRSSEISLMCENTLEYHNISTSPNLPRSKGWTNEKCFHAGGQSNLFHGLSLFVCVYVSYKEKWGNDVL